MQSSKRIVAGVEAARELVRQVIRVGRRKAAARAPRPAPGAADSARRASSPQRIAPRLQYVSGARLPTLRRRAGRDVAQHAHRLGRAERDGQPEDADEPAQRSAGGGLGERDELLGVSRVRHREVGRQQVVLLAVGNLDPQRHAAQVGLVVRLAAAAGVGEPYDGRVGFAGRRKAGAEIALAGRRRISAMPSTAAKTPCCETRA